MSSRNSISAALAAVALMGVCALSTQHFAVAILSAQISIGSPISVGSIEPISGLQSLAASSGASDAAGKASISIDLSELNDLGIGASEVRNALADVAGVWRVACRNSELPCLDGRRIS